MSLRTTNPTDLPHLSRRLVEQANDSLHTRNGGGERRSCRGVISDAKGLAAVAGFSRGDADEGFALERVCRYVSRLCSGTASGLFMRPAAARSSASAAPPCGLRFPSKSCSDKAPEKISPDPPQMQSFGTWEHGPLAQLVPRPRSGDSTNGDTHVPISYVELGRFCQRDLPRCPWPSSARRRRCNDELAADERPGRRARSANHAVEE